MKTPPKRDNHVILFWARFVLKNLAITLGIMTLATFLSFFFRYIGFHESNYIMAYILGVLIVAKQTDGYVFGILASAIGVLAFNFFFTEPYYSFATYRHDYPVTFMVMLIVAMITSTLTAKAKQEARLSVLRAQRTQTLYEIAKSLLKVRSIKEITEVAGTDITRLFNRPAVIATAADAGDGLEEGRVFVLQDDECTNILQSGFNRQVLAETFKTGNPAGAGTGVFADSLAYYLPVKGQSGILGVLGVSCFAGEILSDEQKTLLEAIATQIALALEREKLSEIQQKSKLDMERERLRGNLLRGISHDLRTPLTGILGATATILDHGEMLENNVKRELLQGVYEDAGWLIQSVENILSLTKIDEGRMELKKNPEAVEEIVAEAVSRVKKFADNHTINLHIPEDLIMIPVDGTLIEQVLVNVIDNALKHTPAGTMIGIEARIEEERVVFEVADNGKGIPEKDLPFIFDRFYTAPSENAGRRGTGLGLAISKSIIIAHGGEISAFNNPSGGATFRFVLPLKD